MNSLFNSILSSLLVYKESQMRPKTFIALILFSMIFTGCTISNNDNKEEIIVSQILKSQKSIYTASAQSNTLLSNHILYTDNYTYNSTSLDDILSLELHIGDITLSGYGYDRFTMSNIILDFDLDTLTQDYIYDYQGYMYDMYHDRYHFSTSLPFVGGAHSNPYKGIMQIIGENETLVVSVLDDYYVDIAVYDHYDSYHDRVIHTTWRRLGF